MKASHPCIGKALLGAAAVMVASLACGQSPGDNSPPSPPPRTEAAQSESVLSFVHAAAAAGDLEIKMCRVATLRANSDQVRYFARTLAEDNSKARRKLKEIAWSRNLEVSDQPSRRDELYLLDLQRYAGDEFDREFLTRQVIHHQRAVQMFRQLAESSNDDELRNFALSKLPALETHLQTARVLADAR